MGAIKATLPGAFAELSAMNIVQYRRTDRVAVPTSSPRIVAPLAHKCHAPQNLVGASSAKGSNLALELPAFSGDVKGRFCGEFSETQTGAISQAHSGRKFDRQVRFLTCWRHSVVRWPLGPGLIAWRQSVQPIDLPLSRSRSER
jgi:hypothetical protein